MAERRQLTLLFCDLCQSTALSDRLDPEDMRDVLDAYRQRCAAVLDRYRGTVAYYMGDGILAYFGYPTANEDDAVRAVRAALEIVPAVGSLGREWPEPLPLPLQVRIAVHTGLVVAGEIGVDSRRSELWAVGKAPNVAARLQILAAPNSIVVSDATHRLLRGSFNSTSLGTHELAGIGETIEVLRIESERRVYRDARRGWRAFGRDAGQPRDASWPSSRTAGPLCGRAKAKPCCCPASRGSASHAWCERWSPACRRPAIGSSCCNARPTSPKAPSIRRSNISSCPPGSIARTTQISGWRSSSGMSAHSVSRCRISSR